MKQERARGSSPSSTCCGFWTSLCRRFTALFRKRVKVHDSDCQDEQLRKKDRKNKKKLQKKERKKQKEEVDREAKSTKKEYTDGPNPEAFKSEPVDNTSETPAQVAEVATAAAAVVENLQEQPCECSNFSGHGLAEEEHQEQETTPHGLMPLADLVGVLTVNIKNCRDLTEFTHVKKGSGAAVMVIFDKLMKSTKVQPYEDPMTFNDKIHISVQMSQKSIFGEEDSSVLKVQLVCLHPGTGALRIMGEGTIGLLEILEKPSSSCKLVLRVHDEKVCVVDADIDFHYGFMGCGYSHQIQFPGEKNKSLVQKTCFLRCPPPEDKSKSDDNKATISSTLPPVEFVTLIQPDSGIDSLDNTTSLVEVTVKKRGRLSRLYRTWNRCDTSNERLQFLESLILRKGRFA